MPSAAISTIEAASKRTAWPSFSPSYILLHGEPLPFWPGIHDSFIHLPPPRPKRRRRRITARKRSTIYAATLAADDYSEAAREALRNSDYSGAVRALEVLAGLVQAALGMIRKPSTVLS
jgi:hypothetical protein